MQRKQRSRKPRNQRGDVVVTGIPPPLIRTQTFQNNFRTRFTFNTGINAVSQNITVQNVLDTILHAKTTTTGSDVFHSVRIRSVNVYAAQANNVTSAPNTSSIAVVFQGGGISLGGDGGEYAASMLGTEPTMLRAVPRKNSFAGSFQVSSSQVLFILDIPAYAQGVIDVVADYRTSIVTNVSCQNALVGATAGCLYFRGLDGLAIATSILPYFMPAFAI